MNINVSDNNQASITINDGNAIELTETTLSCALSGEDESSVALGVADSALTLEVSETTSCVSNPYTGAYSWTPTTNQQTISINGKTATDDIVIDPIPSNYGLITWNGSTLTVS